MSQTRPATSIQAQCKPGENVLVRITAPDGPFDFQFNVDDAGFGAMAILGAINSHPEGAMVSPTDQIGASSGDGYVLLAVQIGRITLSFGLSEEQAEGLRADLETSYAARPNGQVQ